MIWLDNAASTTGSSYSIFGPGDAGGASGLLATARQAMGQAYGGTGLAKTLEMSRDDLWTCLNYGPFETEDIEPGALAQLTSWLTGSILEDSILAQQLQARIRPEAAVKLLT